MQELLVTEHHGSLVLALGGVFDQPGRHVTCLRILGGSGDEGDVLGLSQVVKAFGREFVAVTLEVAADEEACLMGGGTGVSGVENVIIPIDEGLVTGLQGIEEGFLGGCEDVKAHEDVCDILREQALLLHLLHYITVQGALVKQSVLAQLLPEIVIDFSHVVPETQGAFFEGRVLFDGEAAEEGLEGCFLFGSDVGVIIQFPDLLDVGEELMCIHHLLVHIIKIGQENLSPGVELVQ